MLGKAGLFTVELRPLVSGNFCHFIDLLSKRGEVPANYYQWKYLEQPSFGKPTGFIAYLGVEPVGCIGIINRIYLTDDGQQTFATWFADWFVYDGVRGMGVGEKLLRKVAEVSNYSFGIPGPTKAQRLASRVGYQPSEFDDFYFFLRPFRYARLKFKRDSYLKAIARTLIFHFKASQWSLIGRQGEQVAYKVLTRDQFRFALGNAETPRVTGFLLNKEFVEWFGGIPDLPNGKKMFWSFGMGDARSVFGFKEVDNYGLVRATILYLSGETLDKETFRCLNRELKKDGIDYLVIGLSRFKLAKMGLKCHRRMTAHFVSLNGIPMHSFALDRENLWYSQQKF